MIYSFNKKTFVKVFFYRLLFTFICCVSFAFIANTVKAEKNGISRKNNAIYMKEKNNFSYIKNLEKKKEEHINKNKQSRQESKQELKQKKNNKVNDFLYSFAKKYISCEENQIFIKNKHAISASFGVSIDRDKRFTKKHIDGQENNIHYGHKHRSVGVSSLHYSVPDSFMNLNGRLSFGFMSWNGLNKEYNKKFGAFGIELIQEIIIGSPVFYITTGIGPSYVFPFKHYNKHINMSSQFYFSIVANIGHRFKNGAFAEVGWSHYSNGELSKPNYGLNSIKITIGYTF